jgi:hypothetical protein
MKIVISAQLDSSQQEVKGIPTGVLARNPVEVLETTN